MGYLSPSNIITNGFYDCGQVSYSKQITLFRKSNIFLLIEKEYGSKDQNLATENTLFSCTEISQLLYRSLLIIFLNG